VGAQGAKGVRLRLPGPRSHLDARDAARLEALDDLSRHVLVCAGRFIILTLSRSFYGDEDPELTTKLVAEAPAIFNWALEGLDRLQERGHFLQPQESEAALRQLRDLASPVSAFVRDCCDTSPEAEVLKDDLWKHWKDWCETEGARAGTKAVFVRDLRAAYPKITVRRIGPKNKRIHVLDGITTTKGNTPDTPDTGNRSGVDISEDLAQPSAVSGVSGVNPNVFAKAEIAATQEALDYYRRVSEEDAGA